MPFNGVPVPGLKMARLRQAMTQAQLAKAAGVATATVNRLGGDAGFADGGRRPPSIQGGGVGGALRRLAHPVFAPPCGRGDSTHGATQEAAPMDGTQEAAA
jgi:hypothetical protein